ncbi:hypothetical protein ACLMJK_008298 [Lecanora helva]
MDLSKLQVSIQAHYLAPANPQLTIDFTVHNHFDHPVTIQIWDTPLDSRCALLGIIEIRDTASNTLLPMDKVYFSRKLPPPPESFVQIDAFEEATNSVSLPMKLDVGKEYRTEAKGRWKAVWDGEIEGIGRNSMETFAGAGMGDFASNKVAVKTKM